MLVSSEFLCKRCNYLCFISLQSEYFCSHPKLSGRFICTLQDLLTDNFSVLKGCPFVEEQDNANISTI